LNVCSALPASRAAILALGAAAGRLFGNTGAAAAMVAPWYDAAFGKRRERVRQGVCTRYFFPDSPGCANMFEKNTFFFLLQKMCFENNDIVHHLLV
jgi:hypothetical protein